MSASNRDLNASETVLNAVGATASQNSPDLTNADGSGVQVFVNTTVIGTGSITVAIQGKDAGSGTYYTILSSAAIVTNVFTVLTVYPGVTAATNASVSACLPRVWRILVTANNANPANYSVGACLQV
jgi:hypothetical protein